MKKISLKFILCCALFFITSFLYAQSGTWTWMKGNGDSGNTTRWGLQGVPDSLNNPHGAYEPCYWTDLNGNFWIFSGLSNPKSALWKYDPVSNVWTWMKGDSLSNQPGIYGTLGVPSPNNTPSGRGWGAPTWMDENGDLWLCGGWGADITGSAGPLNDLWRYNIASNEWTWMGGSEYINGEWKLGTYQTESDTTWMHGVNETHATWVDSLGYFWLFGGADSIGTVNTLWRYNPNTNQWAWMKGDTAHNALPVIGTPTIENVNNTPGSRVCYAAWVSRDGYLWLTGGLNSYGPTGWWQFNDVWRFNPATNNWALMVDYSDNGLFTGFCNPTSYPKPAMENTVLWEDDCGLIWLYGGLINDNNPATSNDPGTSALLWVFDPISLQYSRVDGIPMLDHWGEYGIQGVPSPSNHPPGLMGSGKFTSLDGSFWLFGGMGNSNTVWKYERDTACVSHDIIHVYDTTICTGSKVALALFSGQTYNWSTGDTTSSIEVNAPGQYTAEVTIGSCVRQYYFMVDTVDCSTDINQNVEQLFILYPNPATSNFTIALPGEVTKPYLVNVYSAEGKIMLSTTATGKQFSIDTNGWDNGNYFVSINHNNARSTQVISVVR